MLLLYDMMEDKIVIKVNRSDHARLAAFGDARDSMADCLARVLDLAEAMRDGGA